MSSLAEDKKMEKQTSGSNNECHSIELSPVENTSVANVIRTANSELTGVDEDGINVDFGTD